MNACDHAFILFAGQTPIVNLLGVCAIWCPVLTSEQCSPILFDIHCNFHPSKSVALSYKHEFQLRRITTRHRPSFACCTVLQCLQAAPRLRKMLANNFIPRESTVWPGWPVPTRESSSRSSPDPKSHIFSLSCQSSTRNQGSMSHSSGKWHHLPLPKQDSKVKIRKRFQNFVGSDDAIQKEETATSFCFLWLCKASHKSAAPQCAWAGAQVEKWFRSDHENKSSGSARICTIGWLLHVVPAIVKRKGYPWVIWQRSSSDCKNRKWISPSYYSSGYTPRCSTMKLVASYLYRTGKRPCFIESD